MRLNIFLFLLLLLPVAACQNDHYRVDTASINVNIEINRFEKDLFKLNPDEIIPAIPSLKEKYRGFLQLFSYIINTGDINDPAFGDFLVRFCTDRLNNDVYSLTMKVFPDIQKIENEMEDAFRYYLHYFPGRSVPLVFTCISGFNNSIITGDSVLGISLDRYLGADCEYYKELGIYNYISARMTPENIVPDCMYGWGASERDFQYVDYKEDNVLAHIIHDGKLKYFEKCMLPGQTDEILFGFTSDQLKFCRNNEDQMWLYLIENDLLFNTDQFIVRKLTGEAPFTSYFTNESPGRAAVWIGFRIVESFMMKNPGIKMEDLMNQTDIQMILEKAKYNPQ